jgi:hypothetical protein
MSNTELSYLCELKFKQQVLSLSGSELSSLNQTLPLPQEAYLSKVT